MSEIEDPAVLLNSLRYWQGNLWWHRFHEGKDPANEQVQFALGKCEQRRAQLRALAAKEAA